MEHMDNVTLSLNFTNISRETAESLRDWLVELANLTGMAVYTTIEPEKETPAHDDAVIKAIDHLLWKAAYPADYGLGFSDVEAICTIAKAIKGTGTLPNEQKTTA